MVHSSVQSSDTPSGPTSPKGITSVFFGQALTQVPQLQHKPELTTSSNSFSNDMALLQRECMNEPISDTSQRTDYTVSRRDFLRGALVASPFDFLKARAKILQANPCAQLSVKGEES
jgi:hypothetical protein